MADYRIQWTGPAQLGGPLVVAEVEASFDDEKAAIDHARDLFETVEKSDATGIRVLDSDGTRVFSLSKDEAATAGKSA